MASDDERRVQQQLQAELQVAYMQEFYSTVRDKCFAKCVTKPSSALSSGEQTCLSRCCDRYSDATEAVLKSVLEQSGLS